MFLLSKTCYSLLAFARFEWLLSVLFCFRWNYSVSHFYDVSKKPSLALSFSVLLCQATLFRQSHICICSFLFRLLSSNLRKNTSQVLVFSYCYSWVFLSISFVFLSIVSRFLCNFLDVMQFSRYNSIASLFGIFCTQKCLQSFLFLLLKVEPSKLNSSFFLPRKEVIQPHLPIRLPCYDFTPVICFALGSSLLAVESLTLGPPNSHGVTGGVYKTRERIHRDILIRDY